MGFDALIEDEISKSGGNELSFEVSARSNVKSVLLSSILTVDDVTENMSDDTSGLKEEFSLVSTASELRSLALTVFLDPVTNAASVLGELEELIA